MPKSEHDFLVFIALGAGASGTLKASTAGIAGHLGVSQQTVSRKLRELKKAGLIELSASPSGCSVSLTKQGLASLKAEFLALKQVFGPGKKRELEGTVKNGLGEGRYYVSRPPYLKSFKGLLGFRPFFGTLNLAVDQAELASFLSGLREITVPGFETQERSFGKIRAFKVAVEGKQPAAILFPERTAHPKNEIEVIASANLRKKFGLKEGSRVSLSAP